MKAFDKWYDGQASLDLDYRTARELWHAARKGPKRKLRELREQQSQKKAHVSAPTRRIISTILQT